LGFGLPVLGLGLPVLGLGFPVLGLGLPRERDLDLFLERLFLLLDFDFLPIYLKDQKFLKNE